jgi:hypothetical protein
MIMAQQYVELRSRRAVFIDRQAHHVLPRPDQGVRARQLDAILNGKVRRPEVYKD